MTPEQQNEILAETARATEIRISIAAKRSELATVESRIKKLYREARRKAKIAATPEVRQIRTRERVLRHMLDTGRNRFTARQLMRDLGSTSTAVLHALIRLTKDGKIVRLELGVYAPVKREAEAAE